MEKRYEYNDVGLLSAFAVGEPGKRTFFLAVGQDGEWVRIWLEKEELQAFALAIRQFLFTVSQDRPGVVDEEDASVPAGEAPSGLPSAELEVEEITLGYDQEMATIDVLVQVLGPQRLGQGGLYCKATLEQLKHLGNQAETVCAAGRPRCPLCGGPIEPGGHICPRMN